MLNTPPPIPSNPAACTSTKETEPNNNNNNDIIILDESSSSADSTPTSSPQKQAQAQPSSLIKQATNNLAKKIIESYHSKPHGYIQINDMILPYTNLTEKGYVVCDMYPKCIKYVCLKHLAECNIIRVDTYANKANLKNVFRSYQVASPEQTQSLNEQVQKLTQLVGLKPNNKFSRSDRYDLINLSELFAEYADKALYLQELELESIPERILTGYAEILTLTGGILQYTDPEKKKKHIQPFVDFENKKYVCNLNIKKAIDIYNSQLEDTQLIEMSARELEPALADRFNKFYQLLLFYMNIKYDIKNRKNKFIDVKDAVDKLPNKFRILCSFTSKFPSEWVNNVLEFSARKNTPKKTAIQVPESVSLSPNSMDSGSVSPNEQQQQQNQAKASFIEENINSIESDLSKTNEPPSKICVISDICSLNNEKPTQVLSLSVINTENESNSASSNQEEPVKVSLNENENEKENNCSSSVKQVKKKLAESPEKKQNDENKSLKKAALAKFERNAFSDDVLHRRIELAAYLEIRKKIKLKRLEPNKNYLSRIEALFNKAELATAQVNTSNESELPELDLEMNESAPPKEQEQVEETSNESERQVPDSSINENETNVAVSVVFDLLDVSPNPCTSKSLEEEPNPIQSIQDVLNSCGLNEAAKTTKKEKPKKRASAKGSCDSMSNQDTASVTSEVTSTTGSLDSKLSKKSAASQKSKRKAKNKSLKVNKKKKLNSSSNQNPFGLGEGRSGTESDEDSYGEGEQSDYCESTSFYHKVDSMTQQGASRNREQQQVKKNIQGIESMRLKSDLYDTETFDEEFYLKKYNIKKCSVKLKRISPLTFENLLKNESKEEVKKKIKKSNMDKAETGSVKSATSSSSSAKSGKRKKVAIRKTDSVSDEL